MKKYLIYNHGGSKNHGCEALIRTIVNNLPENSFVSLISEAPEEDYYYGIDQLVNQIIPAKTSYSKLTLSFLRAYITLKTKKNYFPIDCLAFESALKKVDDDYDVALSVGGDVFCYDNYPLYIRIHSIIRKKAKKTKLIGCSLEEYLFDNEDFLRDIKQYDWISARESLTYSLLKKKGLSNISLIPDSAFQLEIEPIPIDPHISGSIGINISPLIMKRGVNNSIVYDNYKYLINKIINELNYYVTLIPHVVWEDNDDRKILDNLYSEFTNKSRIVVADDHNCQELKYIISQCCFLVGTRTHASIAAYSSFVPALVVGYSVKSKGIATDIFGTSNDLVINVADLKNEEDLWLAFVTAFSKKEEYARILKNTIPDYKKRIDGLGEVING